MASRVPTLLPLWVLLQVAALGPWALGADPLVADVRHLTDDILAGFDAYAKEHDLEAVDLPDVQQNFTSTLWVLTVTGSMELTEGNLTNFQQINRYGDSRLSFWPEQQQLEIQIGVELPKLVGLYDLKAEVGVVKSTGILDLTVTGLKATAVVHMNTVALKPTVEELKIVDLGKIKIAVKDGVTGWLASTIGNVVAAFMKKSLTATLESKLPPIINEELAKLDLASYLKPPAQFFAGKEDPPGRD